MSEVKNLKPKEWYKEYYRILRHPSDEIEENNMSLPSNLCLEGWVCGIHKKMDRILLKNFLILS